MFLPTVISRQTRINLILLIVVIVSIGLHSYTAPAGRHPTC